MNWDGRRQTLRREREREMPDPTLMSLTLLTEDANAESLLEKRGYLNVMSLGMTPQTILTSSPKAFYGTEGVTSHEETSTTFAHPKEL